MKYNILKFQKNFVKNQKMLSCACRCSIVRFMRPTQKTYVHAEILKIYPNLRTRTLISWSEKGLFLPMSMPNPDSSGPRTRRVYSFKNVIEIGIIHELSSIGLQHWAIQSFVDCLQNLGIEKGDVDWVLAGQRQHTGCGNLRNTLLFSVQACRRSVFDTDAAKVVMGDDPAKKTRKKGLLSSIVVSIFDLYEIIADSL